MALSPGTRVGAYEVVSLLGAGGMGEVYRARDPRLQRDVALKILPDLFASDPDRLARFQREAQVLASLAHPNIGHLYGLEESGTVRALVLELIEGPTLADRIEGGRIALAEALPIARQIADALDAAHEHGVIHRDLKPANIKVQDDSTVKVLDFGLAKLTGPGALDSARAGEAGRYGHPGITASPTMSAAFTGAGVILGTAAYMAPEQARGKVVDKRADIWAFGCVLFEMLAGKRTFDGADATEMIAGVVRAEPDWSALPSSTPPRVRALLKRCLEKDPKRRLRDIGDVRFELDEALHAPAAEPAAQWSLKRWSGPLAAGALMAGAFAGYTIGSRQPEPTGPLARLVINLPPGEQFTPNARVGLAIAPSGGHVVYTANGRMSLRALDRLESAPIRGTEAPEGAAFSSTLAGRNPFFSPDGRWLAFWQAGELKKVSVSGGAPVTLCAAAQPLGASWATDDMILFSQGPKGIMRVPAAGGTPEALITMNEGETAQGPQLVAGGRSVLFTLRPGGAQTWNDAQIVVHSLDTGARKVLVNGGTDARVVPPGYLVYVREGNVVAAGFDAAATVVTGDPITLVNNVAMAGSSGAAQYAVSDNGSLVYVSASSDAVSVQRTLTWVSRQGREDPLNAPARAYTTLRLSPDETRLAVDIRDQENDIWIWSFARKALTRLTFDRTRQSTPVWSPDGRRVIFNTELTGLYWRAADGTGSVERLTEAQTWQLPITVSPDGRYLVFREETPDSNGFPSLEGSDLMVMELQGDLQPKPLVQTAFIEMGAELSPDGRWLAYQSNESGRFEVYVRPFPNVEAGRWQVSIGGGAMPAWSRTGRELVYVTTTGDALMSVGVSSAPSFTTGSPTKILDTRGYFFGASQRTYDVSADGLRFLMVKRAESEQDTAPASIIVVQNWLEELKRRVPTR